MKVQRVTSTLLTPQLRNRKNFDNQSQMRQQVNELPSAYADFNINFCAQLNRTPANFYEFNKKNLPDTMKNYLNADYEDRQNMPPAQMMRIVYDDLNEIKSLDFVPRIYPEESLFADLTDSPNRVARKGLVAQVETLKDEFDDAPLFKDGTSNLGMYLLKKIYLEGKQKKEINEDLYNDLSKEYSGLITEPVTYSTFSAYGIKFPKVPFWNSFVVTRDDWNYVYKPRTIEGSRINSGDKKQVTLDDILSGRIKPVEKPARFKVGKSEIDRITDAVLSGRGNDKLTEKLLKRKGINDNEELSFVSRYLSQIMSVALENIHASEEMHDFFEKNDTLNKRQREKLEFYWKNNPQMRQLQSLSMSDTIKLFFEAYGADGNNEEFQNLLEYAESIKPAREQKKILHDQRQAEYDEMFAELDAQEAQKNIVAEEPAKNMLEDISNEKINELLKLGAAKNNAKIFRFVTPDGRNLTYVCNVDEMFDNHLRGDIQLLPSSFINKYVKFMINSPLATDEYKESIALRYDIDNSLQDQLMSIESIRSVSAEINKEFNKKFSYAQNACDLALIKLLEQKLPEGTDYKDLLTMNSSSLIHFIEQKLNIASWKPDDAVKLNKFYLDFSSGITQKAQLRKFSEMLGDYVYRLDLNETVSEREFFDDLVKLLSVNLKENPKYINAFKKLLRESNYAQSAGGYAKLFLADDVSPEFHDAVSALVLTDFIKNNVAELMPFLIVNSNNINMYIHDPQIRETLLIKGAQGFKY